MMDLQSIQAANADPEKFRKSREAQVKAAQAKELENALKRAKLSSQRSG